MTPVIKAGEPLAQRTVFKIGGPARFFVEARSRDDFIAALRAAKSFGLPWVILGAGSNVLVADCGFDGMVIQPAGGEINVSGSHVRVDAAVAMARAVAETISAGLHGFEWAIGVPGSIGGSVRGNSGCFGLEMKDVVRSVTVFNTASEAVEEWSGEACEFGYRDSVFKRQPELVILAAALELVAGDRAEGERQVREYTLRRVGTQDIGSQSAGCMFKNIPWDRRDINKEAILLLFPELEPFRESMSIPAGFLIDKLGLKGRRVGGVEISRRHGNFFLNTGGAKAEEVIMLVGLVKEHVHRRYGLILEEEIQYIGFE